jgi:phosphoglycerate kinase
MTVSVPTLDDVDVAGRRVLVRADFNVPMRDGVIVDDRRIVAELPTLRDLIARGAKIVLVTHLGRPKGRRVPELSTEVLANALREHLQADVSWCDDIVGEGARSAAAALQAGQVLVLQNIRFDPREEQNDPGFARELASLADMWCMDAFGTAHRAHASTQGVGEIIPGFAGRLMAREIEVLGGLFDNPARPLLAIIGGSKISTKIGVLNNLLPRVDELWVGGAMASTFLRAQGHATGTSLVEEDQVAVAKAVLGSKDGGKLRLPVDAVVSDRVDDPAGIAVVPAENIPAGKMIVDAGPATVAAIKATLATAATVIWNGPLGVYEVDEFAQATREVARAVAESKAVSVVSGGDLVAAVDSLGLEAGISYISTGGGAALEFLEGKPLPGIAILEGQGLHLR